MAFHDTRTHQGPTQISSWRNTFWPRPHDRRIPSFSARFSLLAGAIARTRQRRKTYLILNALDDRTLDDIGLTRDDLDVLAHVGAATAETNPRAAARRPARGAQRRASSKVASPAG